LILSLSYCLGGCKVVAPNNGGISGGSDLGNALRDIPLIGGMLGDVGDIVSGVGNVALAAASFGQLGSFGNGLSEIGGGAEGLAQITATDVAAGLVGVAGYAYTKVEDVVNILSLGNAYSNGNLLAALGRAVQDALVPDYGEFGGPNWGTAQNRGPSSVMNWVDQNSYVHDQNFPGTANANQTWVQQNWSPTPSGQVAPGPIGVAYVLAGTVPFLLSNPFFGH
jgi:hypothetical protein